MATSKFGSAFADARKSGLKQFEFGGKKYTTELAPNVRSATPAQSDRITARKADQAPLQSARDTAQSAREQSTADTTRASRLKAQAAERNVVEQARARNARSETNSQASYSNEARRTAPPAAAKARTEDLSVSERLSHARQRMQNEVAAKRKAST